MPASASSRHSCPESGVWLRKAVGFYADLINGVLKIFGSDEYCAYMLYAYVIMLGYNMFSTYKFILKIHCIVNNYSRIWGLLNGLLLCLSR